MIKNKRDLLSPPRKKLFSCTKQREDFSLEDQSHHHHKQQQHHPIHIILLSLITMVIISVAIVNRSGKALVARQYRDISRVRIEGLLTAFPKLIQPNSEHTFVETDSVRYVYTPMELLYLVLVTTKSSNIVEDLDTLQMISRVVCKSIIV